MRRPRKLFFVKLEFLKLLSVWLPIFPASYLRASGSVRQVARLRVLLSFPPSSRSRVCVAASFPRSCLFRRARSSHFCLIVALLSLVDSTHLSWVSPSFPFHALSFPTISSSWPLHVLPNSPSFPSPFTLFSQLLACSAGSCGCSEIGNRKRPRAFLAVVFACFCAFLEICCLLIVLACFCAA